MKTHAAMMGGSPVSAALGEEFDLVVLGGGPTGTSGAAAGGLLGKRVALVEQAEILGGAGINTGTLPSKTLRETALVLSGWRSRRLFGVDLSLQREATISDFMGHTNNVTTAERERIEARLDLRRVTQFRGAAHFVDSHALLIATESGEITIRGDKILIATGSSPRRPSEFSFEDERVHDSDEILQIKDMPKTLVVVGGGVIGTEYAGTFAALGVEVHLVAGGNVLMPFLDEEISQALAKAMTANGVKIHWGAPVTACDTSQSQDVVLTLSSGEAIACDAVLVCAGRQSNTDTLHLDAAGIEPGRRGLVPVNDHFQSVVSHIYAAGDVIGAPALAATGIEQARVAIAHAFGSTFKSDLATVLPTGIYSIPEASMVGETERALREKGIDILVGRCRYADLPRGEIIGEENGFLKLIFRREDMRLLGVHVVGEQATELAHIGMIAMLAEADAGLFNRACFNYPTLGDLYKYAAYEALAKREALIPDAGERRETADATHVRL